MKIKHTNKNIFFLFWIFWGLLGLIITTMPALQAQTLPNPILEPDTAILLYNWDDPDLPGSFFYNNTYNDVWGIAINGHEYAIIGSTMGTHIFDITDISNVAQVAFIEGALTGGDVIHRDYADYNGYLYIVCDEGLGISTLQIIDLQQLPAAAPIVYDSNDIFTMAHTVTIDTATAKLYANIPSHNNGQRYSLEVYSIENIIPQYLNTLNLPDYVHDCFVRNDTAYLSTSYAGLYIYYFGNPQQPLPIGSLTTYPQSGYNHSCWPTENGQYVIFADENHGSPVKVADISDLNDIQVVAQFTSGVSPNSIAHNPVIRGQYVYVSYYHDGLQIFNIADPTNPFKVAEYKTYLPSDHDSYRGAWAVFPFLPSGRVLVADMQYGLYVFDVTSTDDPLPTALYPSTTAPTNAPMWQAAAQWNNTVINLSIDNAQAEQPFELRLYNIYGQIIMEKKDLTATNNGKTYLQIPINDNKNNIPQGLYLLQIKSNTEQQIIKLYCNK